MPATYEPIATTTLGTAAGTITFSSIPSTYTDLRLVLTWTQSSTGVTPIIRFNSDTATNYSRTIISGNGTSAVSAIDTTVDYINLTYSASPSTTIPSFYTMDIFSYVNSIFKTSLSTSSMDQNGAGAVDRMVNLWRSTSAISTITITMLGSGTYSIGTTATLYGILKA